VRAPRLAWPLDPRSGGAGTAALEGQAPVYLADRERKVQVLALVADEAITVSGEDVPAFEDGVDHEIASIGGLAGSFGGGFANVALRGPGHVALTTFGDPLVVEPPVPTDPGAAVAWSGTSPGVGVDTGLTDTVGRGFGERYGVAFAGEDGFVVVQPDEEHT